MCLPFVIVMYESLDCSQCEKMDLKSDSHSDQTSTCVCVYIYIYIYIYISAVKVNALITH